MGAGWFRITESRISYTPWTDGRFSRQHIKVQDLTDSKVVFGSAFLRQDYGIEARGAIAGFVIEEASADSKDPTASMAKKKLAAREIVAEELRRWRGFNLASLECLSNCRFYHSLRPL